MTKPQDKLLKIYLMNEIKQHWGRWVIFLIIAAVRSVLFLVPFIVTGHIIDVILPTHDYHGLYIFTTLLVLAPSVAGATIIIEYLLSKFILVIVANLKLELFDGIQRSSLVWIEQFKTGDLINRIMNEANHFEEIGFSHPGFFMWNNITLVLGSILMMQINFKLGLMVVLLQCSKFMSIKVLTGKYQVLTEETLREQSHMLEGLRETTEGMEYIKFSGNEDAMNTLYAKRVETYAEVDLKVTMLKNFERFLIQITIAVSLFLLYFVGGREVINGSMSVGDLAAFSGIFMWSQIAFSCYYDILLDFLKTVPVLKRVGEIFKLPTMDGVRIKPEKSLELEVKNVSYQIGEKRLLDDVSLNIRQGEKVALVGESGSGKSMLTDLILGLRSNYCGEISIGGISGKNIDGAWFRKNIMSVSQKSELRSGSILENVTYGVEVYVDEEVEKVLDVVGVLEWVKSLPKGMVTNIGEAGLGVSGGEKQRIAIARALMVKPQIIIFDEISASLDNKTTHKMINNILEEYPQMTMIFITHNNQIAEYMDRIVEMEQGKIAKDYPLKYNVEKRIN